MYWKICTYLMDVLQFKYCYRRRCSSFIIHETSSSSIDFLAAVVIIHETTIPISSPLLYVTLAVRRPKETLRSTFECRTVTQLDAVQILRCIGRPSPAFGRRQMRNFENSLAGTPPPITSLTSQLGKYTYMPYIHTHIYFHPRNNPYHTNPEHYSERQTHLHLTLCISIN